MHLMNPEGQWVPFGDHRQVVEEVQKLEQALRTMQLELTQERDARKRDTDNFKYGLRQSYESTAKMISTINSYRAENIRKHDHQDVMFNSRLTGMEDRIDAIIDKTQGTDKLKEKVNIMDETLIELEDKLERGEFGNFKSRASTSTTPVGEAHAELSVAPLSHIPIRSVEKYSQAWNVRVVLVLEKSQRNAFSFNSTAFQRCRTRNLNQKIELTDHRAETFFASVDKAFSNIIRGRPWMPLVCLNSDTMALTQHNLENRKSGKWDHDFLESQCIAADKNQGEVIFIALQYEDLTWPVIRRLPRVGGPDESCWAYDPILDDAPGKLTPHPIQWGNNQYSKTDLDQLKTLDQESVYDLSSPPAYTPGTHNSMHSDNTLIGSNHSSLDILANASVLSSERDRLAAGHTNVTPDPNRQMDIDKSDDDSEHMEKRLKLYRPPSEPSVSVHSGSSNGSQQDTMSQPQYIYSGRTKRKIKPGQNFKEAVAFGDIKPKSALSKILHRPQTSDAKEGHNSQTNHSYG